MAVNICLAEDDEGIATMVKVLLTNAGYNVTHESTGIAAWGAISKQIPDLVILDWDMPGMSGFDVLKKMRAADETASVPVIFVTAAREEWDPRHAALYNIAGYVVKPFQPDDLLDRVRKALKP